MKKLVLMAIQLSFVPKDKVVSTLKPNQQPYYTQHVRMSWARLYIFVSNTVEGKD